MQLEDNPLLLKVTGFSMWPFLKAGRKLLIKKVLIETLKAGDIILYRKNNQLVCHRLVRVIKNKEKYSLYVRGDNSLSLPELVNEQMFIGKAAGIVKDNKLISFNTQRRRFINRLIIIVAPWVSRAARISKALIKK